MNVMVINGSYHRYGMTVELVDHFKQGVLEVRPHAKYKVVDLSALDVKFCTGTSVCGKADGKPIGACVIKDAMGELLQEMLACDMLVLASPVYWFSHTALMQRFLERCLPLLQYGRMGPVPRNPVRQGKPGVIIVSTGAPFPFNVSMGITRHAVKMLSGACRYAGCSKVAVLRAGGMERDERAQEQFLTKAFALGKKISRSQETGGL